MPFEESRQETMFDVPLEHIVQSSSGKGWQGLDVAEIIHPLDDFALPALSRHILVINLSPPALIQNGSLGVKDTLEPATWSFYRQERRPPGTWSARERPATCICISPPPSSRRLPPRQT